MAMAGTGERRSPSFVIPDQWRERHAERIAIMAVEGVDIETATEWANIEVVAIVERESAKAKEKEKERFMNHLKEQDAKYAGRRAQWDKA